MENKQYVQASGGKTANCNLELDKALTQLRISEKRCRLIMQLSDTDLFEYDIFSGELTLNERDARLFGVDTVVPNAIEAFIHSGIILPGSADDYRNMYRKICEGAKNAQCYVSSRAANGETIDFELTASTIFDDMGKPVRAVGVRRNVTEIHRLEKESEFGKALVTDKQFICEVDITNDILLHGVINHKTYDGAFTGMPFSQVLAVAGRSFLSALSYDFVLDKLSRKTITEAYSRGVRMITFPFQGLDNDGICIWYEATIYIIRENENLIIRYYTSDINERKLSEEKSLEARRVYERIMSKADIVFEVDLTENRFLYGQDKWPELFGVPHHETYSAMLTDLCAQVIHPEDVDAYQKAFSLENMLAAYDSGQNEIVCDYRRPNRAGSYIWLSCTVTLFENTENKHICSHAYIRDIDAEKRKQLDLIYRSERDSLTGLYNKATTEKYINEFLCSSSGNGGIHGFFIIDIDNFKAINDNFGHAFGDAVLSQVAIKIKDMFSVNDIIGRIGGDEFVILMKNAPGCDFFPAKVRSLCNKVTDSFTKNGCVYTISLSVGIACYNKHGGSYDELYRHSDTALYSAKNAGRNRFAVYNNTMSNQSSRPTAFDDVDLIEPKIFETNISEYIFQILYESTDKSASINSVLELVGKHYGVSRAYIFELDHNRRFARNTFEWCGDDVEPQISKLQNIPDRVLADYSANFDQNGIFTMTDISLMPQDLRSIMQTQGIKGMLQFSIVKNGVFKGFVGYDFCRSTLIPGNDDIADLKSLSNILSMFILEMRAVEQSIVTKGITLSIINSLHSFAYVCDPYKYEILFANEVTMSRLPEITAGSHCYEVIWGKTQPCDYCPMREMLKSGSSTCTMKLTGSRLVDYIEANVHMIDWLDGEPKVLVESVDISKYSRS